MAIVTTDDRHYAAIAAAIRAKSGARTQYRPEQMAPAIGALPTGGTEMEDALVSRPASLTEYSNDRVTEIGAYAFYRSYLTKFWFPHVTSLGTSAFSNAAELEKILFPKVTSMLSSVFNTCSKLKIVGFGAAVTIGGGNCFSYSPLLDTVIFSSNTLCTLSNANAFTRTQIEDGTGYLYVPRALVEAYKNATNWAVYAAQLRAIEDYPEIMALAEEMTA